MQNNKNLKNYLPHYVQQLFKRLGIALLALTICRIVFFINNHSYFSPPYFKDFLIGMWGDAIAIGIWFMPFYFFSSIPFAFRDRNVYRVFLKILFLLILAITLALNLIDVEYFKFTAKRSTSDLFTILGAGDDFNQLIGSFFKDFWWLIIVWATILFLSYFFYDKRKKAPPSGVKNKWSITLLYFIAINGFLFIIARGGLGYRPADMLTLAQHTLPNNTALVSNTPLSIIKTFNKKPLEEKKYFDDESKLFNPIQNTNAEHQLEGDLNVVIIVLESFGDEWVNSTYTPFLYDLINKSHYFNYGIANGKKSIEAMPAIFASIPTLMDNPYISSNYRTNKINGLPALLKSQGYTSAFFHGATNGSMKFDEFAKMAGFDMYFGRKEYGNEAHCDEAWGVLDEYFNPWTAEEITKALTPPFLAGLFTLSSHHPYFVPQEHRAHLPKSKKHPIAQSIAYADYSLKLFFDTAKEQPWYDQTIFVLCADHTAAATSPKYRNRLGMYRIPILIFDPQQRIQPTVDEHIFSHIDIMPTLLDVIGYEDKFYSFGRSLFDTTKNRFTTNYLGGTYHFMKGNYFLNFSDDQSKNLFHFKNDLYLNRDSLKYLKEELEIIEDQLKGIIQRYNHDLINNQMTP